MASTKSFFVGIFLLSIFCSSIAQIAVDLKETLTTNNVISNDGTTFVSTLTVTPGDNPYSIPNYNGEISIKLYVKIDHPHPSELKIQLNTPGVSGAGNNIVILRGNVNPDCEGEDIDATFTSFSNVPHYAPFERCDTSTVSLVYGFVRPVDAEGLTPVAADGEIEGDYELRITDLNSADGEEGVLLEWGLFISEDIDEDGVDNLADNCPLVNNTAILHEGELYQADENQDGVGNECQCDYDNYQVPEGDIKICYYLDNWGKDSHHYKGLFKQRGDWVPLVMPNRYLGEFQPGDYSHKGTWLDCECNSYPILP